MKRYREQYQPKSCIAYVIGQRHCRADDKAQYRKATRVFRGLVGSALADLGFPKLCKSSLKHPLILELRHMIARNPSEDCSIIGFFAGKTNITPSNPVYFRLCYELGIDPDDAGFDYELKRGVDIDSI